jgi:hypothetical protein
MMRLAVICALLGSISTTSCAPAKESGGSSNWEQHEVSFEIKNISWTENSDLINWIYTGNGVLVTKDPLLQKGSAMVMLEYRATPKPTMGSEDWHGTSSGLITDGTGSISVVVYYEKTHYKEDPGTPKLEWRTQGYLRMNPAQVTIAP